jgi:large subunit ribosomal protein L15
MKLGNLRHAEGATKNRKRRGKGRGTGVGGSSGRGTKGSGARSGGGGVHHWAEGGQMPIQRRLPKRGFRRPQKIIFQIVDVGQLADLQAEVVDRDLLVAKGLVRKNGGPVKLLADGEIQTAVKVQVDASSKTAQAKIESAGGSIEKPGKK